MNLNDVNKYELFERYLNQNMNEEEQASFVQSLKDHPRLSQELADYQIMHEAVIDYRIIQTRHQLDQIHQRSLKQRKRLKKLSYLAGGIIAAGTILFFAMQNTRKGTNTIHNDENIVVMAKADTTDQKENNRPEANTLGTKNINKNKQVPRNKETTITEENTHSSTSSDKNAYQNNNIQSIKPVSPIQKIQNQSQKEDTSIYQLKTYISPSPCQTPDITSYIRAHASCKDYPSGHISIKNASDQYQYGLTPQEFQQSPEFNNLQKGNYTIYVKDTNECIYKYDVYVDSKECIKQYKFAPHQGERWEIPLPSTRSTLTIYNRNGIPVYKNQYDNGNTYYWDGRDQSGTILPMGGYRFMIETAKGQIIDGYITIIR